MVSFRSRDHDRREPDGRQYFSGGNEDSKFIREVVERVYFCFDLMLMLRAMMDECPPLALDGSVAIGEGGK